uniref:Uncharacterized protein n=1 Tax=Aegilops tauschii subsp. strangulata TaxID=200361 RepID=A0A453S9N0_AEGTS
WVNLEKETFSNRKSHGRAREQLRRFGRSARRTRVCNNGGRSTPRRPSRARSNRRRSRSHQRPPGGSASPG